MLASLVENHNLSNTYILLAVSFLRFPQRLGVTILYSYLPCGRHEMCCKDTDFLLFIIIFRSEIFRKIFISQHECLPILCKARHKAAQY